MLSHKKFVNNFNLVKINKVIVSNWYQNLDDKFIRECVRFKINLPNVLVVARRLYLKEEELKEAYRHKEKIQRRDGGSS